MDSDHMFHLNFAITLFNHGELAEAVASWDFDLWVSTVFSICVCTYWIL